MNDHSQDSEYPRDTYKSAKDVPLHVWEKAKEAYLAGVTLKEISRLHGIDYPVVYSRKKYEGWRTDLKAEMRDEVFARLAVDEMPDGTRDPAAVVDAAATKATAVVQRQQRVAAKGLDACEAGLAYAVETMKELIATNAAMKEKKACSDMILALSNAQDRLVRTERRAFGLDTGMEEERYDDQLKGWAQRKVAEALKPGPVH